MSFIERLERKSTRGINAICETRVKTRPRFSRVALITQRETQKRGGSLLEDLPDEGIIRCTYLGEGGGVRVEVDETALPSEPVVPTCLQMRNLHGVANALHVGGGVRALRPKNRRHPASQQVAH